MGVETSRPLGSNSYLMSLYNDNIDYKDPENAYKTKKELYNLFINDKLAHIETVEYLEIKIDELSEENEQLRYKLKQSESHYNNLVEEIEQLKNDCQIQENNIPIDEKAKLDIIQNSTDTTHQDKHQDNNPDKLHDIALDDSITKLLM